MLPAAANPSRWLSGLGMGFSGAAVWAWLIFVVAAYVNGESRRAAGVVVYTCIMAGYMTLVVSLGLVPLGALIGWQMPRQLARLRPWPVFFQGLYLGVLAGALTALGLFGAGSAQASWAAADVLWFYLFTVPPIFGVWTGLWAQQWRTRLPRDYIAGWLYYDGACPFCLRWVGRLGFIARQGGFESVPLQSEAARRDLGLADGELPPEMNFASLMGGCSAAWTLTSRWRKLRAGLRRWAGSHGFPASTNSRGAATGGLPRTATVSALIANCLLNQKGDFHEIHPHAS
ncbi:MAG: DCC1-like thiol-disulfide oxidoreductase, partial [Verrucomicrobiota bacterium]